MARIKHIAIATADPEATAKFYREGLGLQVAGQVQSDLAEGYYLTDGYVNIAILKFKTDAAATTEGAPKYTGIHHLGFEVDDLVSARQQIEAAGAVHKQMAGAATPAPDGGTANVEVKFTGPDGVTVDLSQHGWAGTAD